MGGLCGDTTRTPRHSQRAQAEVDAPDAAAADAARARKAAAQEDLQRISEEHKRMIEELNAAPAATCSPATA